MMIPPSIVEMIGIYTICSYAIMIVITPIFVATDMDMDEAGILLVFAPITFPLALLVGIGWILLQLLRLLYTLTMDIKTKYRKHKKKYTESKRYY